MYHKRLGRGKCALSKNRVSPFYLWRVWYGMYLSTHIRNNGTHTPNIRLCHIASDYRLWQRVEFKLIIVYKLTQLYVVYISYNTRTHALYNYMLHVLCVCVREGVCNGTSLCVIRMPYKPTTVCIER